MQILSSAFLPNDYIPIEYTCDGANLSPPLAITGVLPGTKSLVLIVSDPDAPSGDWVHWLVWAIPPKTTLIDKGTVPLGAIQGVNDFGREGYDGPCPPSGTHRYQFRLFALNHTFSPEISPLIKKAGLLRLMADHILDEASLVGLYSHQ